MSVFDLAAAREARDEAIDRVDRHADEDWKREAKRALWNLIQELGVGGEFTTDDLRCSEPREPRVWGAIVTAAGRAGFIVKTRATRPSANPRCHARPKAVWRVTRASR